MKKRINKFILFIIALALSVTWASLPAYAQEKQPIDAKQQEVIEKYRKIAVQKGVSEIRYEDMVKDCLHVSLSSGSLEFYLCQKLGIIQDDESPSHKDRGGTSRARGTVSLDGADIERLMDAIDAYALAGLDYTVDPKTLRLLLGQDDFPRSFTIYPEDSASPQPTSSLPNSWAMPKNCRFSVEFVNGSSDTMAISLYLDGCNSIQAQASLPSADYKWSLSANSSIRVPSWRLERGEDFPFEFLVFPEDFALLKVDGRDKERITVVFYIIDKNGQKVPIEVRNAVLTLDQGE